MVVWPKPCKSRSSPGFYLRQTPVRKSWGFVFGGTAAILLIKLSQPSLYQTGIQSNLGHRQGFNLRQAPCRKSWGFVLGAVQQRPVGYSRHSSCIVGKTPSKHGHRQGFNLRQAPVRNRQYFIPKRRLQNILRFCSGGIAAHQFSVAMLIRLELERS